MSETPPSVTHLHDPGGRAALQLEHGDDRVVLALTGAQVLSWHRPDGDVLWTASYPEFKAGKPVRGGVPLVFPWFGDRQGGGDGPAHGFARGAEWRLVAAEDGPDVELELTDDDATRALWPHAFRLSLRVALRDTLRLTMGVENMGAQPFTFEQALHSYFSVGDVTQASVHGLEGVPFVETASRPEGAWDTAQPLRFRAETDRVFQGVPDELRVEAPKLDRRVTLRTQGARSAIVWNPWPEKTARLSQMDLDDYKHFCCVESANVGANAVTLQPGERHALELTIAAAALRP